MNSAAQNIFILNKGRQERASACTGCTKQSSCPVADLESASPPVQRVIQAGKTAYEAGDRFGGIYIVRSGFLKSYAIDTDGVVQVTGFHLPGEFFGMDGIETGQYGDHVEALDTSSVCRIPLELFNGTSRTAKEGAGTEQAQPLMLTLVKLMSRTISGDRNMFFTLGKMSARRRFGAFLKDLSERMAKSGYSGETFTLCMSRTDIANYLCVALETVSRLFTQLHAEGAISIDRRQLRLRDTAALLRDDPPKRDRLRVTG